MLQTGALVIYPPLVSTVSTPPSALAALKGSLSQSHGPSSIRVVDLNIALFRNILRGWEKLRSHVEFRILARLHNPASSELERKQLLRLLHLYMPVLSSLPPNRDPRQENVAVHIVREIISHVFMQGLLSDQHFLFCEAAWFHEQVSRMAEDRILLGLFDGVLEEGGSLVGFSLLAESQLPFAAALSIAVRADARCTRTVAGGAFITELAATSDVRELEPYFDYLVIGEGESALQTMVGSSEVDWLGHHNIRRCGHQTSCQIHYESPADWAIPDFTDFNLDDYFAPDLSLPVLSSKGCTWGRCTFCGMPDKAYRHKSASRFVSELHTIRRVTKRDHFQFVDEIIPTMRLLEIAREIVRTRLSCRWFIQTRLEPSLTFGVLEAARDAGCYAVEFGLESASKRVLRLMKKGIALSVVDRILGDCEKLGIHTILNVMIGFPGEERGDADATLSFVTQIEEKYPKLSFGCNTQRAKIYRHSPIFARTKPADCTEYPFSTIVKWPGPEWVESFLFEHQKSSLFESSCLSSKCIDGNRTGIEAGPYERWRLSPLTFVIDGVPWDFRTDKPAKRPGALLVVFDRDGRGSRTFQLNSAMRRIVGLLGHRNGNAQYDQSTGDSCGFASQISKSEPLRGGLQRLHAIGAVIPW